MADSTLALAYYRWIRAANSDVLATRPPADALQKALRYRDRLPENGQRLLNAYHASYHQEDAVEGISLLRGNLTTWPEDIESRALLAELLFLYGRTQGLWQDEAEEHFKRVLSYDPEHLDAITYLYWLTGVQERYGESAEWARRRLTIEKGAYVPIIQTELALADPDTARQEQALVEIAGFDDASLWVSVHAVAVLSGNLTGAAKICRLMTDASRPPVLRAEGHVLQAHLACARGRWGESWDHLAAAKSFEGPRTATDHHIAAIESQATLAITPQFVLSRAHLQNTLHELANLEEESMRRRVFRLYLAGILSVRLGDHAAALRRAAALDSIRSAREEREDGGEEGEAGKDGEVELASSWPVLVESLAHGVRAEVAWSLGKPAEALLEIEQTHPEVVWKAYVLDLMYSLTHQRFMRAMLLENAGRLEEALQWYSSLGQVSAQGYVYLAPKHLKMGEIYERLGEAEKAAENYQRFVELWQDCDPEYRSSVDEVRARIPRLES